MTLNVVYIHVYIQKLKISYTLYIYIYTVHFQNSYTVYIYSIYSCIYSKIYIHFFVYMIYTKKCIYHMYIYTHKVDLVSRSQSLVGFFSVLISDLSAEGQNSVMKICTVRVYKKVYIYFAICTAIL